MQEDHNREALSRRVMEGDSCRQALDVLEGHFKRQEQGIMNSLSSADTPNKAFWAACQYQTLRQLMAELYSAAAVGDAAGKELLKGE